MNKTANPREAYIAIASKKFGDDGFHGTSLAALAKEAGVTKQALLHFFGTKERLYAEVLNTLASRLCSEIDTFAHPNASDRLTHYLLSFAEAMIERPEDARLVVRALLDSDPKARTWPMKPYLDKLIDLVVTASASPAISKQEALVWVFKFFGVAQYLAISSTAIAGMYGAKAERDLWSHLEEHIKTSVSSLRTDAAVKVK